MHEVKVNKSNLNNITYQCVIVVAELLPSKSSQVGFMSISITVYFLSHGAGGSQVEFVV